MASLKFRNAEILHGDQFLTKDHEYYGPQGEKWTKSKTMDLLFSRQWKFQNTRINLKWAQDLRAKLARMARMYWNGAQCAPKVGRTSSAPPTFVRDTLSAMLLYYY